jgi:MinD-like ATPase involved in chromosome partitioning or flagellar assembly
MTPADSPTYVLLLAGGADWEAGVLDALGRAGIVVAKRCVDVPDLMASASAGGAAVAVVAGDVPHLDVEVVDHLLRYDVRTVAVTESADSDGRMARLGVAGTARPTGVDVLVAVERVVIDDVDPVRTTTGRHLAEPVRERRGVIAVWGPAGAPGRTTVAVGVADALARAGRRTVLLDADPYGGTVAQALGILDEVSGLLAVARMANLGTLEIEPFARACRRVGEGLDVLTGLPRADRRVEVRPGVLTRVLDVAGQIGDVVVDCGFGLEDPDAPLARDRMTLDALAAADEVLVVGSAEPSGLTRLARGLVELRDVSPAPVRVVVNRMRPTLGWNEREVVGMVEGYVRPLGVHFLPEDRAAVDRALVAGRAPSEVGDSRLRDALADVVAAMSPASRPVRQEPKSRYNPVEV